MELPFELWEKHKSNTKYRWEKYGLICSEEDFEAIYEIYITSSHCEICKKKYKTRIDRCMEHDHETGEFRNICCQRCNQKKRDRKINSNNTSGYKNICKVKNTQYKQGFAWVFYVWENGRNKNKKKSVDIEKVIKFRDQWFEDNPDYFT